MQKTHLCKSSMHANHRMHENHQIRKECIQRRKYNQKYLMGGSRRNELKKKEGKIEWGGRRLARKTFSDSTESRERKGN